ncbi:hypothetical protein ACFQ0M_26195 [Kitasatospora aburaviensis]
MPVPSPSVGGNCPGGFRETEIKATGSGLAGTTLVKGGPAQELSVTFENTSPVDLEKFNAFLFATDIAEEGRRPRPPRSRRPSPSRRSCRAPTGRPSSSPTRPTCW